MSIEQALPLGLIINEAITNAVKHAFGPDGGIITVELRATKNEKALLRISDNGKGISEKAPSDGSGRKLIRALTDQVRGRFDLSSTSAGTTLEVQFFPRHATLPS